jgi:hypothetical protein
LISWWLGFWFTPTDPPGLHRIRILGGLLFLAWLLPFAGQPEAFFGLNGWFDLKAYQDVAEMVRQEGVPPPPLGWSLLFLCGTNTKLLAACYWGSIAILVLFTLGVAVRLTSVLTWLIVVSFTANPAAVYDAETLLVMLAFYLMVGYLFLGPWLPQQSWLGRLLGGKENFFLGWNPAGAGPGESVSANVALRLLQIHFAVGMVACGLHKLQFVEWWSGVAFWMYLHPPFSWNQANVREYVQKGTTYLGILSLALYLTMAWQITFPLFAWRPRWRWLLIGGGVVGWLGAVIIYQLPLFGPVIFICCLSYVTPGEWQRLRGWAVRLPILKGLQQRLSPNRESPTRPKGKAPSAASAAS